MTYLGWRWEGLYSCFMQMEASSDHGNWSGPKGPSMYLSYSSRGLAWLTTSKNPIPWHTSQERSEQGCHRRPPVGRAQERGTLTGSTYGNTSDVWNAGCSWRPEPWWPITENCMEQRRKLNGTNYQSVIHNNYCWYMRSASQPIWSFSSVRSQGVPGRPTVRVAYAITS